MSLEKYCPKIKRHFPDYRFSWEILTGIILENVERKPAWLDIGAGSNYLIAEQPGASLAVGLDVERPDKIHRGCDDHYCLGLAERLPFKDSSFDFITSRYTFEHLPRPEAAIKEITQVLKPGGILVIQTTNLKNPLLKISNIIPFVVKKRLFRLLFGEVPSGTYKTYFRINRPDAFKGRFGELKLERLILVSDIMCHNFLLYTLSINLYRVMEAFGLKNYRDNIIAVYKKEC